MQIVKKYLSNGQYLTHEYGKTSLFFHHTVSTSAESAWQWWNQTPERVGTPYIIDRDGTIIECFDPKTWAFHLGIIGDDNYHEKYSVNVELVSCGRVYWEDKQFKFYPLFPNKLYPKIIPEEDVFIMDKPWRGHKFYHKYSDQQISGVKELVLHILRVFPGIIPQSSLDGFWDYNEKVVKEHLPGIWSHSTVRADKDDIFPYPPLIEALKEVTLIPGKSIPKKNINRPRSQPNSMNHG